MSEPGSVRRGGAVKRFKCVIQRVDQAGLSQRHRVGDIIRTGICRDDPLKARDKHFVEPFEQLLGGRSVQCAHCGGQIGEAVREDVDSEQHRHLALWASYHEWARSRAEERQPSMPAAASQAETRP